LCFTDLTVVADSAFLTPFIVSEIQNHPNWSFVSPLDVNRKITIDRDCQINVLAGVGKKLSQRAICYADLLRWKIEIFFKERTILYHYHFFHNLCDTR